MATFTTSKLARQGGVNLESVRFYEREGLLRKPARTAGGYRMFTHDDVRSVLFIKRAQELGFSLKEIKELLALRFAPNRCCSDVRARAQAKLDDIDRNLSDLKRMRKTLSRLTRACSRRGQADVCPILDALDSSTPAR